MNWIWFVLGAVLSWGLYGPACTRARWPSATRCARSCAWASRIS